MRQRCAQDIGISQIPVTAVVFEDFSRRRLRFEILKL